MLTHVSLFSGIGGFELAMAEAGIPTLAACEIDKKARGVLADRFPGTHIYPDGHTATSDGKPQSDSAQYKQHGNGIAVPVFAWVAKRLAAVDGAAA